PIQGSVGATREVAAVERLGLERARRYGDGERCGRVELAEHEQAGRLGTLVGVRVERDAAALLGSRPAKWRLAAAGEAHRRPQLRAVFGHGLKPATRHWAIAAAICSSGDARSARAAYRPP